MIETIDNKNSLEDNEVIIGNHHEMTYIYAILTIFCQHEEIRIYYPKNQRFKSERVIDIFKKAFKCQTPEKVVEETKVGRKLNSIKLVKTIWGG